MQKIVPNLWFASEAEDAARFYTSIFEDSKIGTISYYGKEGKEIHGQEEGAVMTVEFTLNGQEFLALNGGPVFKFNEAVSFIVNCESQVEVDKYWQALSANPQAEQCGWLKDKFGLSWQIVPTRLNELMSDLDKEKAGRVMNAMLQMKKIDIAALEKAAKGK